MISRSSDGCFSDVIGLMGGDNRETKCRRKEKEEEEEWIRRCLGAKNRTKRSG